MSKKLKLNPNVAYFLGIYAYSKGKAIGVASSSSTIIERFVKTAIDEFQIETNKILFEETDDGQIAYLYNTKLKKLLDKALERKETIFKYRNAYSGSYFAGIYDIKGGKDVHGVFIRDIVPSDDLLLERLDFHTIKRFGKTYLRSGVTFLSFIKPYSSKFETK
jgi:hypothetical protein